MSFLINSITQRLFLSFGLLVVNIAVIAFFAIYFLWISSIISGITHKIDRQRLVITQLLKTDLDFLRFEPVNSRYHETGESNFLKHRDSLFHALKTEQGRLLLSVFENDFHVESNMSEIDSLISLYDCTFKDLVIRINERGFKDHGLEGNMRLFAHRLEDESPHIPLSDLLMLRRHEKDFLFRKQDVYIE